MLNWFRNVSTAASFIKLLFALAATSGGAMTLALLREMPWYGALTVGSFFTASLMMILVAVDHFWRVYGINQKVAVRTTQVRSIRLNPETNRLDLELTVYVGNRAVVPVWMKFERVFFQVDQQTHIPEDDDTPIQAQPDGGCFVSPGPISLDPNKFHMEGHIEVQLKYGRKKDNLKKPYKTSGRLSVHVTHGPAGPIANVIMIGGKSSYE